MGASESLQCLNCDWSGTYGELLSVTGEYGPETVCPRCETTGWEPADVQPKTSGIYQTFKMQDFERGDDPRVAEIDYLKEMFDLEVQNEQDKPIVITLREKAEHVSARKGPPEITAEINTCPTHGAVDKSHRCPDLDGVLRDAWSGKAALDVQYPDKTDLGDGPAALRITSGILE